MKTIKVIGGFVYSFIMYIIYVLDKILNILFTKPIPSFKCWGFEEVGRQHRQNSIIRIIFIFVIFIIYSLMK